ncbi:hypothetical protein BJQ89_00361 [Arthrobacter sp. ES1]|nr:hypothetical protein [Arthrobacter sp. ES1]
MQAPEPEAELPAPRNDLEGLDEIHGHICGDCRCAWVGGMDERELGLDPEISSTFSDSARAFAESARHISCAEEEDAGHGYFDCLICDVTSIGGFKAIVYAVP